MNQSRPCHRRRPVCEPLEGRVALTTVPAVFHPLWYPRGTVGPLPAGSAIAPAGQAMAETEDQPPIGSWSSTAWNSVGAPVFDQVTAQGTNLLDSVQYSIQGGALLSQT